MDEILGAVSMLAQDQYGNYVVQVNYLFRNDCTKDPCFVVITVQ